MSIDIENRLNDLGIILPTAPTPAANYIPFVKTGNILFVSGQVGQNSTGFLVGKIGMDLSVEEGYEIARMCGISLIAQLQSACENDWSKFKRVIKLGGFVNATLDFTDHPKIINGASDLMVEVFGDNGKHARTAVGSSSLPFGVAVEVDGIFELTF